VLIRTKKRYDCFIGTDLEFVLRSKRCDSNLVLAANTNSCVVATGIAASVRGCAVFIVKEGLDSMLGKRLHDAASEVFGASFGWLIRGAQSVSLLERRQAEVSPVDGTGPSTRD